jgi:hypothetical protein
LLPRKTNLSAGKEVKEEEKEEKETETVGLGSSIWGQMARKQFEADPEGLRITAGIVFFYYKYSSFLRWLV